MSDKAVRETIAILDRSMEAILRITAAAIITSTLSACGMNGVRDLPSGDRPTPNSSVVIYGLRIAGKQTDFAVTLDAYDMETGSAKGDCFRWDRMQASVPQETRQTHYFAFQVKPGHYVYNPTQRPLRGDLVAFEVMPGQTILIGEFVLTESNEVELVRDLAKAKPEVLAALPNTEKAIALAQPQIVGGVRLFLCTP